MLFGPQQGSGRKCRDVQYHQVHQYLCCRWKWKQWTPSARTTSAWQATTTELFGRQRRSDRRMKWCMAKVEVASPLADVSSPHQPSVSRCVSERPILGAIMMCHGIVHNGSRSWSMWMVGSRRRRRLRSSRLALALKNSRVTFPAKMRIRI